MWALNEGTKRERVKVMGTRTTRGAAITYAERAETIMKLIEVVQKGLKKHAGEFASVEGHYGRHWGYVGDLASVEEGLRQAAHGLGQDVAAGQDEDGVVVEEMEVRS